MLQLIKNTGNLALTLVAGIPLWFCALPLIKELNMEEQLVKEAREFMIKVATLKANIGPLSFRMMEKMILTKLIWDLKDRFSFDEVMQIIDCIDIIQNTSLN